MGQVKIIIDETFLRKLKGLGIIVDYEFMHQSNSPSNKCIKRDPRKLQSQQLLVHLNNVAKRNFDINSEPHIRMISARLSTISFDDLKAMITFMTNKWDGDEKMSQYLRPSTLFQATKCAEYVEASKTTAIQKGDKDKAVLELFGDEGENV